MADMKDIKITKKEVAVWEKTCSIFWNLFYSFLILNDYKIIIKDLNLENNNLFFDHQLSFIND